MHDKDTSHQVLNNKNNHRYPIEDLVKFWVGLVQGVKSGQNKSTQSKPMNNQKLLMNAIGAAAIKQIIPPIIVN